MYRLRGQVHQLQNQVLANHRIGVCMNHVAHGFVECLDLLRLEIRNDLWKCVENLLHKNVVLTNFAHDKLASALLRYFQKSVARLEQGRREY